MSYIVKPDGSIEVSTALEALELQRLIQERDAKKRAKNQPTLFTLPAAGGVEVKLNGNGSGMNPAVMNILGRRGTTINSTTMLGLIGAKTVAGVGPKLYHLKKAYPQLNDILVEKRDERGIVSWEVLLT